MITALSASKEKIFAQTGLDGYCPICEEKLIPKCGRINIRHWSHTTFSEHCEHERETKWHLEWKSLFNINNVEVVVNKNDKRKLTDAKLKNGLCVEFQHSPISVDEILEREKFYGNMIWVFDCRDAYNENRILLRRRREYSGSDLMSFRWLHAKKNIAYTTKPTYLDLGEHILRLKKIGNKAPTGGYGFIRPKSELVEYFTSK